MILGENTRSHGFYSLNSIRLLRNY